MNAEISAHKTHFEWDTAKAKANLKKHRVSFETAARVFADPFAVTTQDRIEGGEYRWQTLGMVDGVVLLLVAHTLQEAEDGGELIRIISARRADPKEKRNYEKANHAIRT
jgi:uncharacterized DUF497 family protein